jgi:SAM-dependent methyltransferase
MVIRRPICAPFAQCLEPNRTNLGQTFPMHDPNRNIVRTFLKNAATGPLHDEQVRSLISCFAPHLLEECGTEEIAIFRRAAELGYFRWPARLREQIAGKSVLDVGCGAGTHGLGFIAFGAGSYLGLDPGMKLDADVTKDKHGAKLPGGQTPKTSFGRTPREISQAVPRIRFLRGTFEDIEATHELQEFDTIILLNVTEHLLAIGKVFEGCAKHLAPGGMLLFNHDNFYSWKGHHMSPKKPEFYQSNNPDHQLYVDWNHLEFDPPEGHYFRRALNRIRLDDLRSLTEQHFEIEEWDELVNDFGRLTPEILQRHPQYSKRELEVANVLCTARSKKALVR